VQVIAWNVHLTAEHAPGPIVVGRDAVIGLAFSSVVCLIPSFSDKHARVTDAHRHCHLSAGEHIPAISGKSTRGILIGVVEAVVSHVLVVEVDIGDDLKLFPQINLTLRVGNVGFPG
jgi:hypothetical protein